MATVKFLKPSDPAEKLLPIAEGFYGLLDLNRAAFLAATSETPAAVGKPGGGANGAYLLRRLATTEIRQYHGYTEGDELFLAQVKTALEDGAIPKVAAKAAAETIKTEADPLTVLAILRKHIPSRLLLPTQAQRSSQSAGPREVILSSMLLEGP